MNKGLLAFLASLLVVSLSLVPAGPLQADSKPKSTVSVLVTFYDKPGTSDIAMVNNMGGTVKKVFHVIPAVLTTISSGSIDKLKRHPLVKSVEEDIMFRACLTEEVLPWGVDKIDAEQVHSTNKGTGVKVAVLDTGIDLDHPDLSVAGNVTFVPGTQNGNDDNGHGTAVAGIIGALDNDIGVIGVAPEAALYAVKVMNSDASAMISWILSGLEWALDNDMQVINMSLGGAYNPSIEAALTNAYNAGIVIVAGAGNSGNPEGTGNNIAYPAAYMPAIAVGATDSNDNRSSSSSTGYQLEVMAPGVSVYTTASGGGYTYLTGTSASSPHVGGEAALLIHGGMTNNVAVRERIRNSATDLGASGWDTQYGRGLVSVTSAFNFSEPPDQTPPTTTISISATMGNNGWHRSDLEITLPVTDTGGSGVSFTRYSTDWGQTWTTYTSPFVLSTEGFYLSLIVQSRDNAGNVEGPLPFINYKMDKTPPVIDMTCTPTQMERVAEEELVNISYSSSASDSISGVSYFQRNLIDEYGVFTRPLMTGGPSGTVSLEAWCNSSDQNGRVYTFSYTQYDGAGNSTTDEATFTVTLYPLDWLPSWDNRVEITIDHTKITSDLTHFPLLIHISSDCGMNSADMTAIFDELGANSLKLAVTKSDGTTQIYVEVEEWDANNEEAWLWVSKDGWAVSSAADTELYLYYDNDHADNTSFVGAPGSIAAEGVWDSNSIAVYHMADGVDNAHIYDSTGHGNDGTKKAANEPVEAAGVIGKVQDFDQSDDLIDVSGVVSDELFDGAHTIEAWALLDGWTGYQTLFASGKLGDSGPIVEIFYSYLYEKYVAYSGHGAAINSLMSTGTYSGDSSRHYFSLTVDAAGRITDFSIDGVSQGSATTNEVSLAGATEFYIGQLPYYWSPCNQNGGKIDEVRVSNVARSDAWIVATYYTATDNMLSY